MKNINVGPAYPLRGGIANFNLALCQAFNDEGISSDIVSFSLQYPGILFPGKTQFDEGTAPKKIKISTLINSINPFSWYKTARFIIKENPEYIIIHYWMPFMAPALGTIAKVIRRKSNIKVIGLAHNIIPHEHKPGDRVLTKYFVKNCNGFVTLAKSVLDDLSEFTDNKNKIFSPHPIYNIFGEKVNKLEALKYLKLNPEDKHILFFGLIRKYKGLDLLLKAVGTDKIKELNLKVIIAGEFYDDKSEYDKIISDYNLEDNVIITDCFVPSDEIKYYFSASDIVVQPYHTATQSGVSQIAYNFERPMLVTDVGGLAEIVPHGKVGYVTDKSPDSIADAIFDFYENNREDEFSKNVAIEKEKFTWDKMVNAIETLVKSL